jgi:hypothetical protein
LFSSAGVEGSLRFERLPFPDATVEFHLPPRYRHRHNATTIPSRPTGHSTSTGPAQHPAIDLYLRHSNSPSPWSNGLPDSRSVGSPPPSKLARYALQMRLFVGYSGTTLGRRGPPSGCCHSFPSGQFWLRETRGGGKVAQVQRKTCPVVARIRIMIRIAFAPPHDCRSPQFNATQAEGGRMDSPGGKDSL